jgi:hypothetical protein
VSHMGHNGHPDELQPKSAPGPTLPSGNVLLWAAFGTIAEMMT